MFDKARNTFARILATNSMTLPLGKRFLRYGNKPMTPDWTEVIMADQDHYMGYGYAAIRTRANKVASIATANLKTVVDGKTAKEDHPYIKLIKESIEFSDFQFWSEISTYLDLEGVYYLLAVRNFRSDRIGSVQSLQLLNPYNIKRVLDPETFKVTGYLETRGSYQRVIKPEMIIEMRELNPFDRNEPMAMTDAAKESQFTLKTAGDYTRHSLKNNINAPQIISTDVILEEEQFKNFKARMSGHTKGEPIFANGKGAVTVQDLNIELSKAALKDVNEINRDLLFSVTGVSKTLMGIEQSGTTRETSNVQKDLFAENQIIPRIQLITDALNLDYKRTQPVQYQSNKILMIVDNPVESDHDAEKTEIDVRQVEVDLYQDLLDKGYSKEISAQYVNGEIGISELGEPTNAPKPEPVPPTATPPVPEKKPKAEESHIHTNALGSPSERIIESQSAVLKNSVINIQEDLVVDAITKLSKIKKNAVYEEDNLVAKRDKNEAISELTAVLAGFYGIVFNLIGAETAETRAKELDLPSKFKLDKDMRNYIKEISVKVSKSHIETIVDDILATVRKGALEGLSQQELISLVKQRYTGSIATSRAQTIARTETNRAFTRAQFDADKQFIDLNDLQGKVFKQWRTRSDNPCPFCESLEREAPIPFDNAFRGLGSDITVGDGEDKKTLQINFESLEAGNAHPNCSCIYELIIKQ